MDCTQFLTETRPLGIESIPTSEPLLLLAPQSSADRLQTNDQVLSLTDQLNLGVRLVELDTHWVQVGALKQ